MSKHYVAITPRFLSPPPLSPTKISSVCFSVFGYRYPHIVTFVFSFCPDIRGRVRTPGRCTRVKLAPLSHPLTSHRIMSFIGSDLSQIHRWITRFHRFFNVGSTGCILSVALPLIPESYVNFQISGGPPPRRRERDYLRSTRNWTFLTQGYVLDGTAISDVDKREIRTDAPS